MVKIEENNIYRFKIDKWNVWCILIYSCYEYPIFLSPGVTFGTVADPSILFKKKHRPGTIVIGKVKSINKKFDIIEIILYNDENLRVYE